MVELPNKKHELFSKEYLIDLNATQAAIRAGYSKRTARSQGQRLLTNVDIQDRISELMEERSKRVEITSDMVVQEIAKIAFSDIKDFITWDEEGNVTAIEPTDIDTTALQAVKSNKKYYADDAGDIIESSIEVKLHPKLRALEILYSHFNGSGNLTKAQVRKALAEAEIIENTAAKLSQGGKVNELLQALLDVKSGGDGRGQADV